MISKKYIVCKILFINVGLGIRTSEALSGARPQRKTASMKIYRDSYYCFGCGENGDIFTFLQKFYGIPFKDAFRMLGGSYEKPTFSSNLAIYKAKKEQEMRKKKEEQLKRKQEHNNMLIDIYRDWMNRSEPLSDTWCDCCNALQLELYHHEILNEERAGR